MVTQNKYTQEGEKKMDLLEDEENKKPQKTKMQKIILLLLIGAIFLLIISIIVLTLNSQGSKKPTNEVKIKVNNNNVKISNEFIIQQNNEKYIKLKELSNILNYTYYNGEYLKFSEELSKCYIDNGYEIIGLEANSNEIYKTKRKSNIDDYQYFNLSNNVVFSNNNLYLNIKDLGLALNVTMNNGNIETLDFLLKKFEPKIKSKGYEIDKDRQNMKAMVYNLIIVSKDETKGVLNLELEEVIGTKYNTIQFDETKKEFIVSSNERYGVINSQGQVKIDLKYDDINFLSYLPRLYVILENEKYGVLDDNGYIIVSPEYDKLGYPENKKQKIKRTLIIPSFNQQIGNTLVVSKDNKYGLIEIETGKEIFKCDLPAIYGIEKNEDVKYVVEYNNQEIDINTYYNFINTETYPIKE